MVEEYSYVVCFGELHCKGMYSAENLERSGFTPIFEYLFEHGFRIGGEKAKALFVCYILEDQYCRTIEDFWNLYDGVYELIQFTDKIELWDRKYNVYEGFRERLAQELRKLNLWSE